MGRTMTSLACLFFTTALLHVAIAADHQVGGDFGWNLPPTPTFFSDWARNRTYFVGDTIRFKTRANETHTFAEPQSQADFDACVKPGLVFDSIIFISFDRPGRRYFICTVGNHFNVGMKFAIDVLPKPGTPPPSAAVKVGALPAVLFTTLMATLFFFFFFFFFSV